LHKPINNNNDKKIPIYSHQYGHFLRFVASFDTCAINIDNPQF